MPMTENGETLQETALEMMAGTLKEALGKTRARTWANTPLEMLK